MNMNMKKNHTKLLEGIKNNNIHYSSKNKRITSSKGRSQNWLIDLRPILLNAEYLDIICEHFWEKFEAKLPFQIGGMEVAAVPLVTALLISAHKRGIKTSGFIIRKIRKRTGLAKRIEGNITESPIILVDDIFNSGSSIAKALLALKQEGYGTKTIFTVINYQSKKGSSWVKRENIDLHSIFNLDKLNLKLNNQRKLNKESQKILWRFVEPGAFPYHVVPKSTLLLKNNKIYMGTDIGKMVCIDKDTGHKIWDFDAQTNHPKGIWSSPAYHDGAIYFGAYNGILYCLEAEKGKLIWKNSCCDFIGSSPLILEHLNKLYIGLEHQRPRMMGSNAAFDLLTSNRVWERGQRKYQHGSAAYDPNSDSIIFGNADHNITSYCTQTGKIRWSQSTIRSTKYPPAIDAELGIVVAASFDGFIYIIDSRTGAFKSKIKTNDICYTTPLIHNGKIFVGSGDKYFYIINSLNGEILHKIYCRARVYSSPKLIDNKIMFGTNGGIINEIDPENFKITAQFKLPDAITNAVSASEDGKIIYASTCMNEIYAIKRL